MKVHMLDIIGKSQIICINYDIDERNYALHFITTKSQYKFSFQLDVLLQGMDIAVH